MGSGEIWQSKGLVKIVSNGCVHVELMERQCPTEHLNRFSLEFVWKSVTFDRMQDALRTFALDDESVSQYIFSHPCGSPPQHSKAPKGKILHLVEPGDRKSFAQMDFHRQQRIRHGTRMP